MIPCACVALYVCASVGAIIAVAILLAWREDRRVCAALASLAERLDRDDP